MAQGYRVEGAGKIFHHTAGNHPPNQWHRFLPIRFRNDPWFRGVKSNYPWSESGPFPQGYPYSQVKGLGHENDWGVLPISPSEYDDARSIRFAIDFLKHRSANQSKEPFFLACGIFRPHLPWYVPQEYFDLYPIDKVILPPVLDGDLGDVPKEGRKLANARQSDFQKIRDAQRWRHAIQAYLASISYADAQLGRLLQVLSACQDSSNTIVVLWSDHGWHLGQKGHWHKSTLWEESTRIPLVFRVPGLQPGQCHQPVSLLDVFPTLIELTHDDGAKHKTLRSQFDGISLVAQLTDPKANRSSPAIIEYQQGNVAVRSDRYRYIRYRDGGEELYDLHNDAHEWHNLAGEPGTRQVQQRLSRWATAQWADSADTKKAFDFDPSNFRWTHHESGRVIDGKQ